MEAHRIAASLYRRNTTALKQVLFCAVLCSPRALYRCHAARSWRRHSARRHPLCATLAYCVAIYDIRYRLGAAQFRAPLPPHFAPPAPRYSPRCCFSHTAPLWNFILNLKALQCRAKSKFCRFKISTLRLNLKFKSRGKTAISKRRQIKFNRKDAP